MVWEVDWSHPKNTGTKVMARNLNGHTKTSREWHLTMTYYLRDYGIKTPTYRSSMLKVDE